MASIFDVPSQWRQRFKPASYKGARFHCEVNSRESGRRIVEHEFPKKELPYAEDMGRRAKAFTVRGYIIVFPFDMDDLYRRDYQIARDYLREKLEQETAGQLILPTAREAEVVVCISYRLIEEERFGGFCVFDMTFVEAGVDPQQIAASDDTAGALSSAAKGVVDQGIRVLGGGAPVGTPVTTVGA
jgi:prophage DNA circulation protein